MKQILVKAFWDEEAGVWVATSDDLEELVVEAGNTDELERELKELIPTLLELNSSLITEVPVTLLQESHFIASAVA